ncbi:MAG: agmatine deiminase family protein [Reinekea sp.]|jgi:agmatine deiminase
MSRFILPPEWYPQDAVLITWPHQESAWTTMLERVEETYFDLVTKLSHYQPLVIQVHKSIRLEHILHQLEVRNADISNCHFVAADSNDTWARDHGPITVISEQQHKPLNFTFNGWGGKFEAALDNQLNTQLLASKVLNDLENIDWVLEGGSIETDGNGTLMTTDRCNLNSNRNGTVQKAEVTEKLKQWFGIDQVLWINSGEVEGDDTDAHIDTLARFAPDSTIIFQGCQRPEDSHFTSLSAMKQELEQVRDSNGNAYRLIELPLPEAKFADDGHRLPATYANFLITNKLVLVPTYEDGADNQALALIQDAFPNHIITGIDALPLIEEHGSLHCITMQFPKGSLNMAADWVKVQ